MQMTYPMHLTPPSPPVLPYGSPRTSSSPETAPPPARVSQFPHRHLTKYLPPPHPRPPPPPSCPETWKWFPTSVGTTSGFRFLPRTPIWGSPEWRPHELNCYRVRSFDPKNKGGDQNPGRAMRLRSFPLADANLKMVEPKFYPRQVSPSVSATYACTF